MTQLKKKEAQKTSQTTTLPPNSYRQRVLRALRYITHATDTYSRALSARHQITATQLVCLLAIAEKGSMTVAKLADELHISASTLIGVLDRLEAKGYLTRERSAQDRRQVFIHITATGKKFAKAAPSPLQDQFSERFRSLSEMEKEVIAASLERIMEMMHTETHSDIQSLHGNVSGGDGH